MNRIGDPGEPEAAGLTVPVYVPGRRWTVSPATAADAARVTEHHGVRSEVASSRLKRSEHAPSSPSTHRSPSSLTAAAGSDLTPTVARSRTSRTV
jgi:hypothetical protein